MQEVKTISNWISILKPFQKLGKGIKINILMIMTLGLFSNLSYSQLLLEEFTSGIPASWAVASNLTVANNWVPTSATGGYLNTPGVSVNPASNNTVGSTAEYFLITPQFLTPQPNTEVRFFTKQGSFTNRGTIYEVRLSVANQPDLDSFNVVLASWTEAQLNVSATTWEEKIVTIPDLPQGIPVYLAFVAKTNQTGTTGTSGDTWFIDNARVITSCAPVTGINSTMTANGGLINWSHPTATNFEIQIVPQGSGFAPTGTPVSGLSYNASGLTDGTTYDVYIKAICDPTTTSNWTGPFPITTSLLGLSCASPIVVPSDLSSTTYVLSENMSTYHNNQNYTPLTSIGLSCQPVGSSQNWLNGEHIYLSYTPNTTGLVNINLSVNVNGTLGCFNALSSVFIFDSCTGIGTTANCLGSLITGSPSSVTSAQIPNFYVTAGTTYYFVISSPYQYNATNSASICFTFSLSAPSCPIPSGITYNNLTQNSAQFSWTNPQNLVTAWEYVVKPASQGLPNGSDVVIPTNTNLNNLVSSLTANTSYNFFVRSVCGGTPGAWSSALNFKTLCNAYIPPYYTGFNDSSIDCWSQLNLNNDADFFIFGNDVNNEPVAKLRTNNAGNSTNDMLISPQFQLDGVTQKRLRFKYSIYGNWGSSANPTPGPGSFEVKLSTTGVGEQNFTTTIIPLASYSPGYAYIEKIVPIPNITGNVNIAWILPAGATQTGTQFYLDDVYIEDLPPCSEPSYPAVTASSITTTSAELSWVNGYNNSQWEIVVQPLGSGVPTSGGVVVNTNPYTVTNLTHSTQYEYYVRAYCSATLQSVWVGPVAFNTLCDVQPVPYFESLNDGDVTTKKFCWSINNANGDNNSFWTIDDTKAFIRGRDIPFNPFVSFDDWLISGKIDVVGQKMLKFKYRVATDIFNSTARGNLEVLMSSTPTFSTYTVLIPSHDFQNQSYLEDFVIFNGTGPAYFAFRVPPTMTNPTNSGIMMIDDVSIDNAPACPDPSLLTASNITVNSANLSWTPGFVETQWQIVVQAPNTGVPTGAGVVVSTTPTYNATSLLENTNYEYYVRAVCGSDFSNWVGPFSFKTICNPIPTPFIETFEPNSATESCWKIVNNNGNAYYWNLNQTVNPIFGEQMAAMFSGTNGDNDDWLISPTLTVQPNQRLRFYYKVYDSFFEEDLKIKISTNGTDISQFTTVIYNTDVSGIINNEEVKEMIIDLSTITSTTNINIAFHIPTYPPNPWNYRGQMLFIDNVIVENIPVCSEVFNVTTSNLTDTTVSVDWNTTGVANSWEISVQPFGTPAPVGNTLPQYLYSTTSHPFVVNNLTPSTKYEFYVRAICASGQSTWAGPYEITTKCNIANTCLYTISLTNGNTGQVSQHLTLMQNGQTVQNLEFPNTGPGQPTVLDYQVYLCNGVEFNLYWEGLGNGLQYSQAQAVIKDSSNNIIWTSPLGLGTVNTNIYSGLATCGVISCPQPTNLVANNQGVLSWTPGGSETQWEVAIQPLGNATIPQTGITVSSPNYTPLATDFPNATSGTVEFFVRAICGTNNKSYWSGPKEFVRNDEPNNALRLQVNNNGECTNKGTNASFIGATASTTPTSCGGLNNGDVWFEFIATSKVHTVELSNFRPGSYYTSSYEGPWPKIMMSLYEVQTDGSLVETLCSNNNSLVAIYSSELTIGNTYKIRLKLDDVVSNDKTFDICVSTPADLCEMDAFNYSFEKLPMQNTTGIFTIIDAKVVPGWRVNTNTGTIFFHEASISPGVTPYEGGQSIQLVHDDASTWNPSDPNIKGLYKDFDTSDILKLDYSFATATRTNGSTIELWAGPPSGPFVQVTEHTSNSLVWAVVSGSYNVPTGQNTTRFIFRVRNYAIGHLLDAANFKVNNKINTPDAVVTCNQAVNVDANGIGQWVADVNNPVATTIADPNNSATTISGFDTPGTYVYHWKTRYCDEILTLTYQGINVLPTVTTPVQYCMNDTPVALTASAPAGYSLLWFTSPNGGTGDVNAPIPSTTTVGSTTYYVALVDSNGCYGPRTPIEVIINPLVTPIVTFTYDSTAYCSSGNNPVLVPASGFFTGGTFSATPAGLSINSTTGAINIAASATGIYDITYTLNQSGCTLAGSANYTIEVTQDVTYNLESLCDSQIMYLNVVPTNGSDLSNVDYLWQDANNTTIGTNSSTLNVNDYLALNTGISFPTTISVTVTIGGCSSTKNYTIEGNECSLIPRGISPNGDGDNDTFNLTGLGVKELSIFNRYGTEVYMFRGNYTNQFIGNDKNGSQLTDGTYFYNITFQDGKSVTGWVYIIRQY